MCSITVLGRCKLRSPEQMWVKRERGMVFEFDYSDATMACGGDIAATSSTRITSKTFTTGSVDGLSRSIFAL